METGERVNSNLISIIVPVYNGQKYIDRCVRSILEQTYSDWELLLVDGASEDESPQLCDLWQVKDSRIRVFHSEKNRGVSAGRNTGLRNAKGAYIMFVDVDDWLRPDCLFRLYEDIQQEDVEIAGCSFIKCTDSDWEEHIAKKAAATQNPGGVKPVEAQYEAGAVTADKKLTAGGDFLREGILEHDTRCWSKLYKKELVAGHFFNEDYAIGEDMLFVREVAGEAKLISSSAYAGYCYYHNVNGAMLKRFSVSDMDQIRCWQFLLESLLRDVVRRSKDGTKTDIEYDTDVISKTASILLISCMLVVGKLAALPARERKQYAGSMEQCSSVLKETLRIDGAYAKLDRGYRIKVWLYKKFPGLYMGLYHIKMCVGTHRFTPYFDR